MSDFSIKARCTKHGITFAPDDGGCPQCDDSRCPTCGKLPGSDGEYPCSCEEEASLEAERDLLQGIFDCAWHRGNYAHVYEGVGVGVGASGLSVAQALLLARNVIPSRQKGKAPKASVCWSAGFVLGVYSSFEAHEVGLADQGQFEAALRFAQLHDLETGRDETAARERDFPVDGLPGGEVFPSTPVAAKKP